MLEFRVLLLSLSLALLEVEFNIPHICTVSFKLLSRMWNGYTFKEKSEHT